MKKMRNKICTLGYYKGTLNRSYISLVTKEINGTGEEYRFAFGYTNNTKNSSSDVWAMTISDLEDIIKSCKKAIKELK